MVRKTARRGNSRLNGKSHKNGNGSPAAKGAENSAPAMAVEAAPDPFDDLDIVPPPGEVWEAWLDFEFRGYVITDRRDPNYIWGMAAVSLASDDPKVMREHYIELLLDARKVSLDQNYIKRADEVVDYRHCQGLNADRPMPVEFFAYQMREAFGNIPPGHDSWMKCTRWFIPSPFCRFRFAMMIDQFIRLNFTKADRADNPIPCVGVGDGEGGRLVHDLRTSPEVFQIWQQFSGQWPLWRREA